MEQDVLSILEKHGAMALATLRPDGWPQATLVNYANDGVTLFFVISRSSQKYANILANHRTSIAIGSSAIDPKQIKGLSMAASTWELKDESYRSSARDLLAARHPGYFKLNDLDFGVSVIMRAEPEIITISDYSQGLGHADVVTVGAEQLLEMKAARPDNWGYKPASAFH